MRSPIKALVLLALFTVAAVFSTTDLFARLVGVDESLSPLVHRKLRRDLANTKVVPGQYLIILEDDVADVPETVEDIMESSECNLLFVYQITLKGFALSECSEANLAPILDHPAVQHAERDELVQGDLISQDVSSLWHLDRIDQPSPPLDGQYEYEYDGTGVTLYVLDSGVRSTHEEFGGRAKCGFNAYEGREPCDDNFGHGTFDASIAAGFTHGTAKNADIVNVRVLTSSLGGSSTRIIAGIEYVGSEKMSNSTKPMVANMSL